jgi:hypothetical protein
MSSTEDKYHERVKNNKAAGADSIAVELLKNAGPNLVDASHDTTEKLDREGIISSLQEER